MEKRTTFKYRKTDIGTYSEVKDSRDVNHGGISVESNELLLMSLQIKDQTVIVMLNSNSTKLH